MKAFNWILAVTGLVSAPLAAHDFWIEPLSFDATVGNSVAIRLKVGENYRGDAVVPGEGSIASFTARDAIGARPLDLPAVPGVAGIVAARQAGLLAIGYESRPSAVTLSASRFEQYLAEEGLEHVIAERARHGAAALPGRELFARSAKSIVRVDGESSDSAVPEPLGLPLEFVTSVDPYSLTAGSSLDVELLYRGRPAADVLVVAIPRSQPDKAVRHRTDSAGRVALQLAEPGAWLIKAVLMEAAPAGADADWMSWWASLTFAIPRS